MEQQFRVKILFDKIKLYISVWVPEYPSSTHDVLLIAWKDIITSVSNHRRLDCLLSRLFWRRSKKTSKLRVTGLCEGNSPVTGEFPAQMASNAENVSIWWRHRALSPDGVTRPQKVKHIHEIMNWQWQWQWKYVYYHRFTYIQDTGCKISIHWK